jgi:hypothetical protein
VISFRSRRRGVEAAAAGSLNLGED